MFTSSEHLQVILYSVPVVTAINYIVESPTQAPLLSVNPFYRNAPPSLPSRLFGALLSVVAVVAINKHVWNNKQKKLCQEDKEFLVRWGHCKSPYHSSSSDSDSSLEGLISY